MVNHTGFHIIAEALRLAKVADDLISTFQEPCLVLSSQSRVSAARLKLLLLETAQVLYSKF